MTATMTTLGRVPAARRRSAKARRAGLARSAARAGLAHAGLTHEGDELPVTAACSIQGREDRVQLSLAPDEASQAPRSGGLQTGSCRLDPDKLEDLDRLGETSDRDEPA